MAMGNAPEQRIAIDTQTVMRSLDGRTGFLFLLGRGIIGRFSAVSAVSAVKGSFFELDDGGKGGI
jgi:hypothetical protein